MTGSLSVRGMVLPVGGVTAKVQAAIDAGLKYVIIPESNKEDVYLGARFRRRIKILYVKNIAEVLGYALKKSSQKGCDNKGAEELHDHRLQGEGAAHGHRDDGVSRKIVV